MTGPQYREIEGNSYYTPPVLTTPIPEGQCSAKVTPKWFVCDSEYHPHLATYRPMVNGKEAFGEVHRAIAAAWTKPTLPARADAAIDNVRPARNRNNGAARPATNVVSL